MKQSRQAVKIYKKGFSHGRKYQGRGRRILADASLSAGAGVAVPFAVKGRSNKRGDKSFELTVGERNMRAGEYKKRTFKCGRRYKLKPGDSHGRKMQKLRRFNRCRGM